MIDTHDLKSRDHYLNKLIAFRDTEPVKVVTGIRRCGKSSLLKNVTSGYHYHTVRADSEEILDLIGQRLKEQGFLAPLQGYEPVDCAGCG